MRRRWMGGSGESLKPRAGRGGFTLIEILMVIVIVGVIAGVCAPPILSMTEAQRYDQLRSPMVSQAQTVMDRLSMEIYRVRNGRSILRADDGRLSFENIDGEDMDFWINNHELWLKRQNKQYLLSDMVVSFNVIYFNEAHRILTAANRITGRGRATNIRAIGLEVGFDNDQQSSFNLRTEIHPRNFEESFLP